MSKSMFSTCTASSTVQTFTNRDAVNNELALLFPAPSASERGSGSESLAQELTNRMPPGLQRGFRSYLHAAGLDGPTTVKADIAEAMTAPYLWLIRRAGRREIRSPPAPP
jgi:hypothetical protein